MTLQFNFEGEDYVFLKKEIFLYFIVRKSVMHQRCKTELRTYGWTMPSYIILNLSLCCDIYLFCLVLESACLLSKAFYLQVFLLFASLCAWVLLPARLWLCFNAYFIACFCFDSLFMYVFVLCIMYCMF